MTIIQAKQKILEFLLDHDSVSFSDFNKFFDTTVDNTEGISACFGALQELATDNIVFLNPIADITKPTSLLYVLKQPLVSRNQNTIIDGELALRISEIVNGFGEQIESDNIACDPLNIKSQDINILCDIIGMFAESNLSEGAEEQPETKEEVKNNKSKNK